jgi:hypothetical protein
MTPIHSALTCDTCKEEVKITTTAADLLEIVMKLFAKKHEFCGYDLDKQPESK